MNIKSVLRTMVQKFKRSPVQREDPGCSAAASAKAMEILSPMMDHQDAGTKEKILAIRQVLEDADLMFEEHFDDETHKFMLNFASEDNPQVFRAEIMLMLDETPSVCVITVYYPFCGDRKFIYPLSQKIIELNYRKRYGGLQYDYTDQELRYRYAFFLPDQQFDSKLFVHIFKMVLRSADDRYDELNRYACGRLSSQERKKVMCNCQKTMIELSRMDAE